MGQKCCAGTIKEKPPPKYEMEMPYEISDQTKINGTPWHELKLKLKDPFFPSHQFREDIKNNYESV